DRAEADDFSLVVGDLGQQFGLVDRAGVIFEAAYDGTIYNYPILPIAGRRNDLPNRCQFLHTGSIRLVVHPRLTGDSSRRNVSETSKAAIFFRSKSGIE